MAALRSAYKVHIYCANVLEQRCAKALCHKYWFITDSVTLTVCDVAQASKSENLTCSMCTVTTPQPTKGDVVDIGAQSDEDIRNVSMFVLLLLTHCPVVMMFSGCHLG